MSIYYGNQTEREWLTGSDTNLMSKHGFDPRRRSERKLRLIAGACCRRIWDLIPLFAREALEVSEKFADGQASRADLEAAYNRTERLIAVARVAGEEDVILRDAAKSVHRTCNYNYGGAWSPAQAGLIGTIYRLEVLRAKVMKCMHSKVEQMSLKSEADLFREVLGNPYRRPPRIKRDWLVWDDNLIPKLAVACYENRFLPSGELDPDRLAILSDALEEAGCTAPTLLSHLRGPGPHVRGCWALDLILGME